MSYILVIFEMFTSSFCQVESGDQNEYVYMAMRKQGFCYVLMVNIN